MSTMEIVRELEGVSLGTPPCGVYCDYPKLCGKPSSCRVLTQCSACGPMRIFICRPHVEWITAYGAKCAFCGQPRGIDGFC